MKEFYEWVLKDAPDVVTVAFLIMVVFAMGVWFAIVFYALSRGLWVPALALAFGLPGLFIWTAWRWRG